MNFSVFVFIEVRKSRREAKVDEDLKLLTFRSLLSEEVALLSLFLWDLRSLRDSFLVLWDKNWSNLTIVLTLTASLCRFWRTLSCIEKRLIRSFWTVFASNFWKILATFLTLSRLTPNCSSVSFSILFSALLKTIRQVVLGSREAPLPFNASKTLLILLV